MTASGTYRKDDQSIVQMRSNEHVARDSISEMLERAEAPGGERGRCAMIASGTVANAAAKGALLAMPKLL